RCLSDWSSDVCSSDLPLADRKPSPRSPCARDLPPTKEERKHPRNASARPVAHEPGLPSIRLGDRCTWSLSFRHHCECFWLKEIRSEERRVGQESINRS